MVPLWIISDQYLFDNLDKALDVCSTYEKVLVAFSIQNHIYRAIRLSQISPIRF